VKQQVYPGQQPPAAGGPATQMYPGSPPSKTMPPPPQQPRRHPDFAKEQQPYPPYQQRPALYGKSCSLFHATILILMAGSWSPASLFHLFTRG